ncbi:MAG: matrixin family metalloprotease [Patescibacteria group bacterium]
MKKAVIGVLIFLIVVIFGSFSIRYFANAPEQDNWFNRDYRAKLSRYPLLRSMYGLHWDGDGAADYLMSARYPEMDIVINRFDECSISPAVTEQIQLEVERVVKKSGQVRIVDGSVFALTLDSYDRPGIRAIASKYHERHTAGQTAVLNVYCLNSYSEQPSNVGLTVNEDGVVVFFKTLQNDVGSLSDALETYLISTILHEFGHQLGLPHGTDQTCLMAETVEVAGELDPRFASFTPVSFCPEEIQRIEEIRSALYNSK